MNFDAVIREGKSLVAMVARDQRGNLVAVWTEQLDQTKSLLE